MLNCSTKIPWKCHNVSVFWSHFCCTHSLHRLCSRWRRSSRTNQRTAGHSLSFLWAFWSAAHGWRMALCWKIHSCSSRMWWRCWLADFSLASLSCIRRRQSLRRRRRKIKILRPLVTFYGDFTCSSFSIKLLISPVIHSEKPLEWD